jgi:hypothetical protein
MDRIFPSAIAPPHQQVPHVNYDRSRLRINMYKPPTSFDRSTCLTTRRACICYFETTNLVLEEKRQGTEVRVRRIAGETAG